ncbi:MAG: DNA polymerase III subunit [Mariprofundaceae bacterium]
MISVVGHKAVQDRFLKAMGQGRLPHAWLLYGQKGIGKSLLAEAIASAYLCEQNRISGSGKKACGECHSCKMFSADSHPDYYKLGMLEKKRDVNIEQIRQMLAFIQLSGAESRHRVIILDDAECLNIQAANALLKGLEEPAHGNLILLVSNDHLRLPPTVRSRCILQLVSPLSPEDCLLVLQNLGIAEQALGLAGKLACGSPGRVSCMQKVDICEGLEEWYKLMENPAEIDIGTLETWISRNIKRIPHKLISDMVIQRFDSDLSQQAPFSSQLALQQAAEDIARWPELLRRHSLRPAQSLLALVLCFRLAWRDVQQAI